MGSPAWSRRTRTAAPDVHGHTAAAVHDANPLVESELHREMPTQLQRLHVV